jgi:CheY-like chemotaxis protein
MTALHVTNDLLFSSQVQSAADQIGVTLNVVRSAAELPRYLDAGDVRLVILDLTTADCGPGQLLPPLRRLPECPHVVAYAPHVMKARLQAARDAGCDQVLTRGQFHARMGEVLEQFAVPPGPVSG